jgi:hypothetical protein
MKISNRVAAKHDEKAGKVGSFTGHRDDREAIGSLFGHQQRSTWLFRRKVLRVADLYMQ